MNEEFEMATANISSSVTGSLFIPISQQLISCSQYHLSSFTLLPEKIESKDTNKNSFFNHSAFWLL